MKKVNQQEVFDLMEKGEHKEAFDLLFDYFDLFAFETIEQVLGQYELEEALQPIAKIWESNGDNRVIDFENPTSVKKFTALEKEIKKSIQDKTPDRNSEIQKHIDELVHAEFTKAFLVFRLALLSMRYQFYRTGEESVFVELRDIETLLIEELNSLIDTMQNRIGATVIKYIETERNNLLLHSYLLACFYYSHFRDYDLLEDYAREAEELLSRIPEEEQIRYRIIIDLYLCESEIHEGEADEALSMLYRLNNEDEVKESPYYHSEVKILLAETLTEYFASKSGALGEAQTLLTEAGKIKSELHDRIGLVRIYQHIGNLFSMRGALTSSLKYLKKGKELVAKMDTPAHLPELLYALAENLTSMREVEQAKEILSHADEVAGGELFEGQIHYLSAVIDFIELQDNDSVEYYSSVSNLEEAMEIFEEHDYEEGLAKAHLLLAQLYLYDVEDVSIFELEGEENYLFYIYKLQEAAHIFRRYNRYNELLNAYFLIGEIYYRKSSKKKAEEVWQFLSLLAHQVDRAIDARETDFAGFYLKKIRSFIPSFTPPERQASEATEQLTEGSLTEESLLITVRCENVAEVLEEKGKEAFGSIVKNIEKALLLLEKNLHGSEYINYDFVDYHFFLPYSGKDSIATALGLSSFLYVIFSHYYQVKMSLYSGTSSIELEDLNENELFRHSMYHRGMEKSRDIFPSIPLEHFLIDSEILEDTTPLPSAVTAPTEGQDFYQKLQNMQVARDKHRRTLTKMFDGAKAKDPTKARRLSVKIENFIQNHAHTISESQELLEKEQLVKKRLNTESYFQQLQYGLQQSGIDFDFDTAIDLQIKIDKLNRAIQRYEKGDLKNPSRMKKIEKVITEIVNSSAIENNEAHPLKSYTLSLYYLCPHCAQQYEQKEARDVIKKTCSYCGEKIESYEEVMVDMHKEIKDLIHLYSVPYHRFSEDIEKMDKLFPFLNSNSYKKNTNIKLYNKERKMSYMLKLKRSRDRHDVQTSALRHITLKKELEKQREKNRREARRISKYIAETLAAREKQGLCEICGKRAEKPGLLLDRDKIDGRCREHWDPNVWNRKAEGYDAIVGGKKYAFVPNPTDRRPVAWYRKGKWFGVD